MMALKEVVSVCLSSQKPIWKHDVTNNDTLRFRQRIQLQSTARFRRSLQIALAKIGLIHDIVMIGYWGMELDAAVCIWRCELTTPYHYPITTRAQRHNTAMNTTADQQWCSTN